MDRKTLCFTFFSLLALSACTVEKAIDGESRWFYRAMSSQSYRIPVAGNDTLGLLHTGQGKDTLVFIHGFGPYPRVQWQPMVWGFGDQKSMYIVDLLAFGESSSDDSLITIEQQSEAIWQALDSLGVHRYGLIAHSYGGMVAAYLAGKHPEEIENLVLIDPLNRYYALETLDSLERALGRPIEEVLLPKDVEGFDLMQQISIKDPLYVPEFVKQRAVDNIYTENASQREGLLRAIERDANELKTEMNGYSGPTLLIWGESDAIFPVKNGRELLQDYPNARLEIIRKSGHSPHMERPFEVLDVLREFYLSAQSGK
ncbi:MAG: alpha/beta hydrolase [Schleiferiaceae bacterium]|nr:alpha/beta hydrolase [Schleiferiaceae bacterium]